LKVRSARARETAGRGSSLGPLSGPCRAAKCLNPGRPAHRRGGFERRPLPLRLWNSPSAFEETWPHSQRRPQSRSLRARAIPRVEPDHALAVRTSLRSDLPLHAPLFAWPRVTRGAGRGCVRGALLGCAFPVLAIGGANLLSFPRSRAGPVGAAQSDRVPAMPPRRLVASALIRPIMELPVRSLRRRHLHPFPFSLPSRSDPARCRLLHDFAHTMSRGEALAPVGPGRASAVRCGRTARSRVPVRPFRGDACDRRGTRGWRGRSARPRGSPTGRTENTHSGSSSLWSGGRPSHPHSEIESPGCHLPRPFEAGLSRRRRLVEHPWARHLSRMSCSPQSTQYWLLRRRCFAWLASLQLLRGIPGFTTSPHSGQNATGESRRP
jgi:hypothetical protein